MSSPLTLLADAIPDVQRILTDCSPRFEFASTNRSFTPIIAQTLHEFMLNRKG
jgi:hypothetical protein